MSAARHLLEPHVNRLQQVLNERLDELNLRQQDLARLSGINESTLRRILVGPMKRTPTTEQLKRLAGALVLPLDYLNQLAAEVQGLRVRQVVNKNLELLIFTLQEDPPLTDQQIRVVRRVVEEFRREET